MPRKYGLVVFLLITMLGCGRSSLSYQDRALTLSIDQMVHSLNVEEVRIHYKNYQTLYITQRILTLQNGNTIVLEETQTDDIFQYENSTAKSIEIIFETKNIIKVYGKNFLNFYQLKLQDGNLLNLITQQSDDQELILLYGMDTHTFKRIIAHFDTNASITTHYDVIGIDDGKKTLYTKWNATKVHLEPLVVPLKFMMGGS